jgi:hypothetical protein
VDEVDEVDEVGEVGEVVDIFLLLEVIAGRYRVLCSMDYQS